ncbi:hypothetical protein STEG23_003526, partial [Scotinomys teguina]
MEELHGENEGKLEKEGKPEDEVESEDEEKSDGEKKPDKKAKPARQGKLEEGPKPGEQGQPQDEGKSEKQGKSEGEGKRQGEGKQDSQAKAASEARAAEKRPAEDYVPRKAKRKTDRGTDDSPKDSQEDLQDRHTQSLTRGQNSAPVWVIWANRYHKNTCNDSVGCELKVNFSGKYKENCGGKKAPNTFMIHTPALVRSGAAVTSEVVKKLEDPSHSPTQFIYVVYYIDRLSSVEPSLHLWDKAYLVMVNNVFDVFLDCYISNFISDCFNLDALSLSAFRFTKMDTKNPKTLFDLAIQSLLRNESVLLQALEDIPRDLFVPLFTAAFQGGHKNVVIEMVKVWPFHCLHIGPLTAQQSQGELLKATIENFPVCPAENSASWRHKLRILDLRRDNDCRTTCRQLSMKEPSCFHSCAYSDSSIRKIEGQLPIVNSGSMIQICRPVELLVDLFLHGSLLEKDIFNLF